MRFIDSDTVKVMLAAATPFIVWGSGIELALRIVASSGAVVYICMKIFYLFKSKGK